MIGRGEQASQPTPHMPALLADRAGLPCTFIWIIKICQPALSYEPRGLKGWFAGLV